MWTCRTTTLSENYIHICVSSKSKIMGYGLLKHFTVWVEVLDLVVGWQEDCKCPHANWNVDVCAWWMGRQWGLCGALFFTAISKIAWDNEINEIMPGRLPSNI